MEKWQRDYILHNLSKLIESTDCSDLLLTEFRSKQILAAEDVQVVESKETSIKKSRCLFDILLNRKNSYEVLISALHETCQSGSVEILLAGLMKHGSIEFQGNPCLISELLTNLDETFTKELISLHQNQPSISNVVVKNTIPCKLDYYISRTIVSHRILGKPLFQEKCSDVFVFHGVEWNELSLLAGELPTEVSSDLVDSTEQLHTRHVLLESLDHFDNIVNKTNEPVHLIQQSEGNYHWLKSRGTVQTLLKFVDKTPYLMKEETFIQEILKDNISVCLTDSPGMGKTVLLGNLARAIVNQYPQRLVIFIHLREFVPDLLAKLVDGAHLDNVLVQTLLSQYCSDDPVGRRIVVHKLVNDQSHLCFDGFDEVLPEQREVAKAMLKIIANSFLKCQTFVTARLHMREEIGQTIGTLGFHIAPFNLENQIVFLTKFWKCRGAESENLKSYAETCLTVLASQMNKDEQDIAGIPLQCFMIGEVFLNKAKCYNTGSFLGAEVPITSMAQLYNNLINTKLDTLKDEDIKESLILGHMKAAMDLLFPDEVSIFVENENLVDFSYEQLCRVGIMEHVAVTGSSNQIRFVHRTFAEFFVGLFASRLLQNLNNESLMFTLKKILATYDSQQHLIDNPFGRQCFSSVQTSVFKRPVIAYFLNFQLQQQNLVLKANLGLDSFLLDQFNFVLAAVSHDSAELLNLCVSLYEKYRPNALLPWSYLQLIAAKHPGSGMLEGIFHLSKNKVSGGVQIENSPDCEIQVTISPLYIASYIGNYKIVDYLMRSKHVSLVDAPFVLHFCMWYSSYQSEAIIKRKVQIIKYLAQRSSSVLHKKLTSLTPILGPYIHIDLIKCCIECGANVHDRDKDFKSLLHITPKYMTPDGYHNLILYLLNSSGKELLNLKDVFDCTPLHYAVQCLPILSDTLQIFLSHGADINAKDKEGNSVMFHAVRYGTESTLELLEKSGANLDDRNTELETALHISRKYCNPSALEWLIKKGVDTEATDAKGNTPSQIEVNYEEYRFTLAQKVTVASGDDKMSNLNDDDDKSLSFPHTLAIAIRSSDTGELPVVYEQMKGNTPLHNVFLEPRVDINKVKFQHRLNADFNAQNVDGETALHYGVLRSAISKKVLDFAVKVGGADLNIVNNTGYSVLAQAIRVKRHISFLNMLVEYGADVCRLSNFKTAIMRGRLRYVKFLLHHGADIIKVSQECADLHDPISFALKLHEDTHYEIAKCLITSAPQLIFEDPMCTTHIIYYALQAYKKSDKFRTVELFNLMASHGLNYAICSDNKVSALLATISDLSVDHCKCFVAHLHEVRLKELFHIQDENLHNLLFYCVSKFAPDRDFLSLFSANGVDFNGKDKFGNSLLWHAIKHDYSQKTLEALTFYGANPHVVDGNANNLMITSIKQQSTEAVEFLSKVGVSFHSENKHEGTPFMYTCGWYINDTISLEMFELVARFSDLGNLVWNQVLKVYLWLLELYESKEEKKFADIFEIFKLYELHPTSWVEGEPLIFNVLHFLGLGHAEKFLNFLVNVGLAGLDEVKSNQGMNVVQYFIATTNDEFPIKLLPLLGNVRNIINSCDKFGRSLLAYAIHYDMSVEYMKQLIENGTKVNQLDINGLSLLHYGAYTGNHIAAIFFADIINDKNCVDKKGYSALHYAFSKYTDKHYNVAKQLISKGVSVNLDSFSGKKTIDMALKAYQHWGNFKSVDIFTLMLSQGLDIESNGRFGSPVLFQMMNVLSPEHCEEILMYLYNNNKTKCFHFRGHYGDTLLHRCLQNFEPSKKLLNCFKLAGTDFNAMDKLGNSVLFYAVLGNRTKSTILALMSHGANWNTRNSNGDNILHNVVKAGNFMLMEFFITLGADNNCKNVEGKLPMQNF